MFILSTIPNRSAFLRLLLASIGAALPAAHALEEFVMPRMQQNTYLSHAKDPALFGLEAVSTGDGPTYAGHAQLTPSQVGTIFFDKAPLPVIMVGKNSGRLKMSALLDTSSPNSWIEFITSRGFDATFLGIEDKTMPYGGAYNTGGVPAYAAVIPHIKMDTVHIENAPVYVRMAMHSLGPLARGIVVPEVESVFGYDLLKTFEYIRFDFKAGTVRFSTTKPYEPEKNFLMTAAKIVEVPGYGLAVEGAVSGVPSPIILDVAGDYHFARGDVKMKITKQVDLGDVVYRKVPTLLLPTHESPARAGRKMLEPYVVTIAPKKGVVYFEHIPE